MKGGGLWSIGQGMFSEEKTFEEYTSKERKKQYIRGMIPSNHFLHFKYIYFYKMLIC